MSQHIKNEACDQRISYLISLRQAQDLTHAEYRVLTAMLSYADGSLHNASPGNYALTRDACCSHNTTKQALRTLVQKGYLVCTAQGGNQVGLRVKSTYALALPARGDSAQTRPVRRKLSAQASLGVFARDGYACQECGSREELTVDHIVPVVKGGTNATENLRTLCRTCNTSKGARLRDIA